MTAGLAASSVARHLHTVPPLDRAGHPDALIVENVPPGRGAAYDAPQFQRLPSRT